MSDTIKFNYQGQAISFEFSDGNRLINANQMAKPFGKRIDNFLRLQGTKEFIVLLESRSSDVREREVLRVVQGGTPELQGTWMDEKLALKFAAWLSPEFELWVYDRIQELLTKGNTSLQGIQPQGFANTLRLLAEQWEKQEKINENVRQDLDQAADKIKEIEAKILSIDENYYSVSGYCQLIGLECPHQQAQAWGKTASKLSRAQGVPISKVYDPKFGAVNGYHTKILKQVIR